MSKYKLFITLLFLTLGASLPAGAYGAGKCAPPKDFAPPAGFPPPGDFAGRKDMGPPPGDCFPPEKPQKAAEKKAQRAEKPALKETRSLAVAPQTEPKAKTLNDLKRDARDLLADLRTQEMDKIEDKRCPADGEPRFSGFPRFEEEVLLQLSASAEQETELRKFLKAEARDAKNDLESARREKVEECEKKQAKAEEKKRKAEQAQNKPGAGGFPGMPGGRAPNGDCVQCNAMKNGGAPNQSSTTSQWLTGIADVLKAGTPIALGAMNLGGNIYAMNKQSSDYRYYNDNNTALGLPSSSPTSYGSYTNTFNSTMGSLMSMSLFSNGLGGAGLGGYGMGMNLGMGMGGYGMGASLFGGNSLFGGYGTGMGMSYPMYGMSSGYYPGFSYGYGGLGLYRR